MEMKEHKRRKLETQTYRRWDLGYGGEKKPDDTLINEDRISKTMSTASSEIAGTAPVSKVGVPNGTCLHDTPDDTSQGA